MYNDRRRHIYKIVILVNGEPVSKTVYSTGLHTAIDTVTSGSTILNGETFENGEIISIERVSSFLLHPSITPTEK